MKTFLTPKETLNKAYRKVKPSREQINKFKDWLQWLLTHLHEEESEEHNKNLLSRFLREAFYSPQYFVNTKGRSDLVIHNGKDSKSTVGVIIEVKRPGNKTEMPTTDNINTKALQELVWYFLGERIPGKNDEVKHLIVTNLCEWLIFDAQNFDKVFAQDKNLVKKFEAFRDKKLSSTSTDFFYREIAQPFIANNLERLSYTYLNLNDYRKALVNPSEENKLIPLLKILSPEHLLKLPFLNDSNTLDKRFYSELLYIIGLEEIKQGSKKIIQRKESGLRHDGSLLENAITQLDNIDRINRMKDATQFGDTYQERLFNVGLELCITWINRILFLKLLEAQLVRYHRGDTNYAFLKIDKVSSFDDLNSLFFGVLARKPEERSQDAAKGFEKVPYLNSSLFEPSTIEDKGIFISNLRDDRTQPIHGQTVLKDHSGKRKTGDMNTLAYLFEFLNAYDFSSEGSEDIQEENKTLINASVLGLIFEKINGYKDGSFFTPGFITMYMCRETIRRAVLQKFSKEKGWDCKNLNELYDRIEDRAEANRIINSLKICDPAVGSGHFLVSALNEIIAIKSELRILQDREGRRLKEYQFEVVNDELVITDEESMLFEYRPGSKESQRVQKTLFHEKQAILEGSLFGVDINPNSVKICRLRLWIELLKNAYYKAESGYTELETLPNIDINIKCGNSLVSRFPLDADLRQALKKSKWTIDMYRIAVQTYRNAHNKEEKREMLRLIEDIKSSFRTEISGNDPKIIRLAKLKGELFNLTNQGQLFDISEQELETWNKQLNKLTQEISKLEAEIKEVKNNKIYQNAFEWRFEFPEVLNNEGDFVGFDVVIGNPPYGVNFNKENCNTYEKYFSTFNWRGESYILFVERAVSILKNAGHFAFIIPDTILNLGFTEASRKFILKTTMIYEIVLLPTNVFSDATVDTILLFFQKNSVNVGFNESEALVKVFAKSDLIADLNTPIRSFYIGTSNWYNADIFNVQCNPNELKIINRLDAKFERIEQFADIFYGIKAYQIGKGKPPQSPAIRDNKPFTGSHKQSEEWFPFFDGKDIGYYSLLWNNNWIHYGPWLAEPRDPEKFEGEKILIRKITGKTLIAHYISDTSYCNTLLFVLKLRPGIAKISYKELLGVLNSKFIGWYFRKKFQINEDDTFPQIMIRDIQKFAVPNLSNDLTKSIKDKVVQLIAVRKINPTSDTTEIENQIDQLVYQLYDLTEEEIEIIETIETNT